MPQDQIKAEKEMTEDEAWEELEQRLKREQVNEKIQRAQIAAAWFINENKNELGIMTLRLAFEMGYRYGYTDGKDSRTN